VGLRPFLVAGTLFVGLLRPAGDGDRSAVVAEFDVDLRLLVSGDLDFDAVFGLGLADVGAIGAGDVCVAEEGRVEVEEWMVIERIEERAFAAGRKVRTMPFVLEAFVRLRAFCACLNVS